ncbi:hypothetical protein V1264_001331 [Littorina saxatilis]|uniref:adenosine deaminase n=2 Tax=Littorina saxatilis TaxID=31220 RepID=A0AAN9GP15_9CAEN
MVAAERSIVALNTDIYLERRQQALQLQRSMRLGAKQVLNEKEELVNQKLMQWKQREINQSLWEGTPFPPELHFFRARPFIDNSPVFHFIRQLPKGGNLHNHFGASVSLEWFVQNVTYRPHCYVCRTGDGLPLFHFFHVPHHNPDCQWRLVAGERDEYSDTEAYDTDLARNISVVVEDPETAYPSIRSIWLRFEPYFIGVLGAVNYLPVFSDYLWRTLEEFLQDGVQYLEIRFTIELYDLDGSYSDEYMVVTVQDVVQRFKQQHPDFIDAKIIIASIKGKTMEQQMQAVTSTVQLCEKFPDDVLGFDLIQHEDTTPMLLDLLHILRRPASPSSVGTPFFFHAGETAWTDLTDENLVDAVLLNTTRIGHGYALLKHPWVLEQVRERGIAIEINPISNQVLKLVTDLRNHPGSVLLSQDYPVVVASDDPAVWGATPLSHDFYVTFMALASTKDDLRVLKQLAINSLRYSALKSREKEAAMKKWEHSYNRFIDDMYATYVGNEE